MIGKYVFMLLIVIKEPKLAFILLILFHCQNEWIFTLYINEGVDCCCIGIGSIWMKLFMALVQIAVKYNKGETWKTYLANWV